MNKVLLLGSQHGDEPLGDILKKYIRQHAVGLLPYVDFKTANLRAKSGGVRYIESDMNRSYESGLNTYESRRAMSILRYIDGGNYNLILDLHTTNCIQPPSLLIRSIESTDMDFLRATRIRKVIEMKHPIAKTSLIGVRKNVVSIEISNDDLHDTALIASITDDIGKYINSKGSANIKQLYSVTDLLLKTDVNHDVSLINFQMSTQGFIPILTGENSYKKNTDYLGFRTDKVVRYRV